MLRNIVLIFLLIGQASSINHKGENTTALESVRKLTPAEMEAKLLPLAPFAMAAGVFGLLGLGMMKDRGVF